MCQENTGEGVDLQCPLVISYLKKVNGWYVLKGYAENSLQYNGYGTESMAVEIVSLPLDVGTANDLVLYRLSKKKKSMKISNFKLRVVIIRVYKSIDALPCSLSKIIHQLVRIYMNSTAIHLCAK